jgi:hypothetical protein
MKMETGQDSYQGAASAVPHRHEKEIAALAADFGKGPASAVPPRIKAGGL